MTVAYPCAESVGVSTTWTCHQTNEGSTATARAIGYATERTYRLLRYDSTHEAHGPQEALSG